MYIDIHNYVFGHWYTSRFLRPATKVSPEPVLLWVLQVRVAEGMLKLLHSNQQFLYLNLNLNLYSRIAIYCRHQNLYSYIAIYCRQQYLYYSIAIYCKQQYLYSFITIYCRQQ